VGQRTGKWTKDEGATLTKAVEQMHGKNRDAIAALVPNFE
jgi:hypothetical protein